MIYKVIRNIIAGIMFIFYLLYFCFGISLISEIGYFAVSGQFLQAGIRSGFLVLQIIVIIITTLLIGRVYCSIFCPMGLLQDFLSFFSPIKKKWKSMKSAVKYSRYVILGIVAIMLALSLAPIAGFFDPYTLFGKITVVLIRPIPVFINNFASSILESRGIYIIFQEGVHTVPSVNYIISGVIVIFILIMSVLYGRGFCMGFCPVGIVLNFFSRDSLIKLGINDKCVNCGKCENQCKTGCIDVSKKEIESGECVLCFQCVGTCPVKAVGFERRKNNAEVRRGIVREITKGFFAMFVLYFLTPFKALSIGKRNKILPAGAKDVSIFSDKCTGCYLCVEKCPVNIITPMKGSIFPVLDYNKGFCQYECNECTKVCPTNAISPMSLEEKKLTKIGNVEFIKKNCIVYKNETDCGACSEHCPTKAAYMIDYKDGLLIPATNTEVCIGCGACEFACPAEPKAIVVNPIPEQGKAKKVEVKPAKKNKVVIDEEFPF